MTRSYTFHDAELRALPLRLFNRLGSLTAKLGLELTSLAPDSIVSAARRKAGSHDLGSDSYREPLEIFTRALEEEAQLSAFGRVAVRGTLVSALEQRIRLTAWAKAHPALGEEEIRAPWVIVGLPRTGTTLLSFLLALDPRARALLHWEGESPVPPPTLATAAEDPRIARSAKRYERLAKLNPAMMSMHPMGATLPQECVALFMYDLRTLGLETQGYVPSYGRWLQSCDMRPAYQQHRLALQTLQSAQPTERWVLKTPNHLWSLETLLEFYPDARVIWTHRDPGKVVTSVASLNNALQRMFTDRRDPVSVANEWRAKLRHAVCRGIEFEAEQKPGWCHHLRYADFMEDPVREMEQLYAHWGEELTPLHRRRIAVWLQERAQGAFGRHLYDPADFGWSYEELAADFRDYRERYDIPPESP